MTHILIVPCNPSAFGAAKSVTRRELFAFAIDADEPIERTGWRALAARSESPRVRQDSNSTRNTRDGGRIIDASSSAATGHGCDRRPTRVRSHYYLAYFAGRTDGLRPPNNSEELLVATT